MQDNPNLNVFHIFPLDRFASGATSIKRPREITHFSFDENHEYRQDDSSMRYYYPPPMGANLSDGFETFKNLDDTKDDHLDALLKAIIHHEKQTGKRCQTDIVSWRGMITKIMSAPYDKFDGFSMNATSFQGTVFIEEDHDAKLARRQAQNQQQRQQRRGQFDPDLMSYWGYKFEALALLPDPFDATSREFIENRENEVVSNYEQYCSVVQTGIGSAGLIIGGEVDGIWDCRPENPEDTINWVELKTSQEIFSEADNVKFERKLNKFWIQSFLLGVPKIIVGFRSKDGILQRIQELNTQKIPGQVKRAGASWDVLKSTIKGDGVWKIRRAERSPVIEVTKVEATGTGAILSKEFLDWRNQLYAHEVAQMLA
ncbi:Nitrogen regulatory protein [Venturia inaequalis]|nr:Nitrogen regulatory protein [Venturia inaequalis]